MIKFGQIWGIFWTAQSRCPFRRFTDMSSGNKVAREKMTHQLSKRYFLTHSFMKSFRFFTSQIIIKPPLIKVHNKSVNNNCNKFPFVSYSHINVCFLHCRCNKFDSFDRDLIILIYYLFFYKFYLLFEPQPLSDSFPVPSIAGFNSRANGFVEIRGFLNMNFFVFFKRNNVLSYLEKLPWCSIILFLIGKVQKTISKNSAEWRFCDAILWMKNAARNKQILSAPGFVTKSSRY